MMSIVVLKTRSSADAARTRVEVEQLFAFRGVDGNGNSISDLTL
jgi:hypothetical protein